MAKLKAHGTELYRKESAAFRTVYMSDGTILRNRGDGWKVYATIKKGVDVNEFVRRAQNKWEQVLKNRPHYDNYRRAMIKSGSLYYRSHLSMLLNLMPGDPDGIWVELEDSYDYKLTHNLGIDEIVKLDRLARLAEQEANELKED